MHPGQAIAEVLKDFLGGIFKMKFLEIHKSVSTHQHGVRIFEPNICYILNKLITNFASSFGG
jgi:hypothetical protein